MGVRPKQPGPARTRKALTGGEDPELVLAEARTALCVEGGGVQEAFRKMFSGSRPRLPSFSTSFATKVLHFMGYQSQVRPRPLIYDERVAAAVARMPSAPPLPAPAGLRSAQYEQYCQWAQDTGHEPIVVEYALFDIGGALTP